MNSAPLQPPTSRRRMLMPLMIVIVAIALIVWNGRTQPSAAHAADVLQHITDLCRRAGENADLRGRLNPDDPFTEARLIEQLQRLAPDQSVPPNLALRLIGPEALPNITLPQRATHHVMLSMTGVDQLGLHIEHPGDAREIVVLGYWLP